MLMLLRSNANDFVTTKAKILLNILKEYFMFALIANRLVHSIQKVTFLLAIAVIK